MATKKESDYMRLGVIKAYSDILRGALKAEGMKDIISNPKVKQELEVLNAYQVLFKNLQRQCKDLQCDLDSIRVRWQLKKG